MLNGHSGITPAKLFLLAAVGSVGAFYFAQELTSRKVSAQAAAVPFYLERRTLMPNARGTLTLTNSEFLARRSDGTTASIKNVGPIGKTRRIRTVDYINGDSVTLFDSTQVKTTWPRLPDAAIAARRVQLASSPPDCGAGKTLPYVLIRLDTLNNEDVAVVQLAVQGTVEAGDSSGEPRRYRLTRWIAPRLGCEDLYVKSELLQEDGTYNTSAETRVISLIPGEPDGSLFDPEPQFREVTPTEGRHLLITEMRLDLSTAERALVEHQNRDEEARYKRTGPRPSPIQ